MSRAAPDEHVLVVLLHHIAADGWSDRPLLRDLAAAYAARRAGRGAGAGTPLPVQYADYTLWQRELLGDPADPDSLAGPAARLLAAHARRAPEELELPTDRPRPARPDVPRRRELLTSPRRRSTAGLRALARETGASVFMVLHAAVAALLPRLGAGDGHPARHAGRRPRRRRARRPGRLLRQHPGAAHRHVRRPDVRASCSAGSATTDLAAFAHPDVPFEAVVERLNPARSAARNPLFQVMVGYHNADGDGARAARADASSRCRSSTGTAKFDLVFSFAEHADDGRLDGRLEYATDLFDPATAERLGDRLRTLLAAGRRRPGRPGSADVDLLDGDERRPVRRGLQRHRPRRRRA